MVETTEGSKTDKLMDIVFFGTDQNESMLVRLDRVEQVVSDIKQLKWVVVVLALTVLVNIITSHWK